MAHCLDFMSQRLAWWRYDPAMDVLSDVLAVMRTGQPYAGRSTCHAPFGVRFPVGDSAACHVVLAGSCWLVPPRGEPLALGVGDVLFTVTP